MKTAPISQLHTHLYFESFLLNKIPTWETDIANSPWRKEAERYRATNASCGLSGPGVQGPAWPTRICMTLVSTLNLSWAPVSSSRTYSKIKIPSLLKSQNFCKRQYVRKHCDILYKRKNMILLRLLMELFGWLGCEPKPCSHWDSFVLIGCKIPHLRLNQKSVTKGCMQRTPIISTFFFSEKPGITEKSTPIFF